MLKKKMDRSSKIAGLLVAVYSFIPFNVFGYDSEKPSPLQWFQEGDEVEGNAYVVWESRYVSAGRDTLAGDSLIASSFEFGWKQLAAVIWYGDSPEQNYNELELSVAFVQEIGDFSFYTGYGHIELPFEDTSEDEISAGFTHSNLPFGIELSTNIVYSLDTDGYYVEMPLSRDFTVTDQLGLNVSSIYGINQGYVSDGHDGSNSIALRVGATYAINESISIIAHMTYSWALDKDTTAAGDEALIDFAHGSIGLQWGF